MNHPGHNTFICNSFPVLCISHKTFHPGQKQVICGRLRIYSVNFNLPPIWPTISLVRRGFCKSAIQSVTRFDTIIPSSHFFYFDYKMYCYLWIVMHILQDNNYFAYMSLIIVKACQKYFSFLLRLQKVTKLLWDKTYSAHSDGGPRCWIWAR